MRSPIIHFGSQYMWEIWRGNIPKDSKVIVNFFHGKPEDGPEVLKHIEDFVKNHRLIDIIVVSNSISQSRLISWGVPEDKIVKIYIGVDSKIFKSVYSNSLPCSCINSPARPYAIDSHRIY